MSLRYKFNTAATLARNLPPQGEAALGRICDRIRSAQQRLNRDAAPLMAACGQRCRGLCCRNIAADDIITLVDCIFVWSVGDEALRHRITGCLPSESLFTADCLFLADGRGPCIFPDDAKPLKCIVTFCGDETPVRASIQQLRGRFRRLFWHLAMRRPSLLLVM
jgi:hypothetical protein